MALKSIDIIAGARPNFVKIAAIIKALEAQHAQGNQQLGFRLIHTGQHYDAAMSGDFFKQLAIPEPDINLEVGSGTQAQQTAGIMMRYEEVLLEKPSDACVVVGDVTSTMACAIVAQKLHIPVAHVEAGIRSGDWKMPEEINRMVTDAITNWFFTTTPLASDALRQNGVGNDRIFLVGNTMIDTLLSNRPRFSAPAFFSELGLVDGEYVVMTLHRPSNVDGVKQFADLLKAIGVAARGMKCVFPVHPRTKKTLEELSGVPDNICFVDPQPYLQFNYLVERAKVVVTDSGGITEETTVLGVPCITLRDSTERPETVTIGTNELIGIDPKAVKPAFDTLFDTGWKKGDIPEMWDGKTGERIVSHLTDLLH